MFKLAAEQRHVDALFHLALIYKTGFGDLVELSKTKSMSLLEEAANLGHSAAQVELAKVFSHSGSEDIQRKGVFYSTLAASQGIHTCSYNRLGNLFSQGVGGLGESLYLAKHYYELGANLANKKSFCK